MVGSSLFSKTTIRGAVFPVFGVESLPAIYGFQFFFRHITTFLSASYYKDEAGFWITKRSGNF